MSKKYVYAMVLGRMTLCEVMSKKILANRGKDISNKHQEVDERIPLARQRFECRCGFGETCPVHPDDLIDERDE